MFLAPILAYSGWVNATRGTFGLTQGYSGHFLYGRVMAFADCTGLELPHSEQALCSPAAAGSAQPAQPHVETVVALLGDDSATGQDRRRGRRRFRPPDPAAPAGGLRADGGRRLPLQLRPRPAGWDRNAFPNWYFTYWPGYPAGVEDMQGSWTKYGGTGRGDQHRAHQIPADLRHLVDARPLLGRSSSPGSVRRPVPGGPATLRHAARLPAVHGRPHGHTDRAGIAGRLHDALHPPRTGAGTRRGGPRPHGHARPAPRP